MSTAAELFRTRAVAFCDLIQNQLQGQELPQREFLARLRVSLADLYAAALRLPDVDPVADSLPSGVASSEWQAIYEGLQAHLPRDAFWEIFDPGEVDQPEAILGSLADALADIYRDLREGTDVLDGGATQDDAVWTWRDSFTFHWGHHVLDALRAIACLSEPYTLPD